MTQSYFVLMVQPPEGAGTGVAAPQDLEHHRPVVFSAVRAEDDGVHPFVQDLEPDVTRITAHGTPRR
jgi:hypothetical protein